VHIPSNFTALNGTNVTFYFPTYELHHYYLSEMLMRVRCRSTRPHSVTQASFDDPCVYLNDTDGLVCYPEKISPSGSQMIKNVSQHLVTSFSLGVTISRDSHLVFLQGPGPLWSRNGRVSTHSNCCTLIFVCCVLMTSLFL